MSIQADRNLLVGILALQLDFVTRDQLVAAMHAWVLEKATPLDQILLRQHALRDDAHALLTALVAKHLEMHGGDPQQSLAAISSVGSLQMELQGLADPDVEATLTHLGRRPGRDRESTASFRRTDAEVSRRFRVLRPHAKGGLGEVFVAQDIELNREVALKEIQAHHADDATSRARFVLEAEITGGLEHPGIVPVYALGQYSDGRPFYAMRFIRGDSLGEAVDQFHQSNPVPSPRSSGAREKYHSAEFRKLLGRFVDVCNAIAYAHSRGVLHRDLKPGNIMLGKYGETLVVDWGLAKAQGREEGTQIDGETTLRPSSGSGSSHTEMGQVVGTPAYMSPEQAAGRLDELGVASDVYSLGATLYYLLAGQAPFTNNNDGNLLRRVERGEFPPPRTIKPEIPKPLEAICLRAMATRPQSRYANPLALSDDVEHYLADEPLAALPDTFGDRLNRFARRNRTLVRSAAAALLVVAVVSTVAALVVDQQRRENAQLAKDNGDLAEQKSKLADDKTRLADEKTRLAEEKGKLANDNAKLAADEKRAREEAVAKSEALQLALAKNSFARGLTEYEFGRQDEGVRDLQLGWSLAPADSAWRKQVANVLVDRVTRGGRLLMPPLLHNATVSTVAFSPDGLRLATGSDDKTARLWNPQTGEPLGDPLLHDGNVTSISFSPDGARLATGSMDGKARLWNSHTGMAHTKSMQHASIVLSVAFSPDGERLATGSEDNTARLWNARTGEALGEPIMHEGLVSSVVFSPDGERLATGCGDKKVRLWNSRTRAVEGEPLEHVGVRSISFSPDGARLATGGSDRTARLWNANTGAPIGLPLTHGFPVFSVAFSPDGERLATGCSDKIARFWNARTGLPLGVLLRHGGWVSSIAFSPDGERLATGSEDKTVRVWNALVDEPQATPLRPLGEPVQYNGFVKAAAFSSNTEFLATASDDKTVRLWKTQTGVSLGDSMHHEAKVNSVAFSLDGTRLLSGSSDRTAHLWDARTGASLGEPLKHQTEVWSVAFSPDGKRLATGQNDSARLWNSQTGAPVGEPLRPEKLVLLVTFSPYGERLATCCSDGTIQLWNAQKGVPLGDPQRNDGGMISIAFSPKGERLATGGRDGVRLWNGHTGAPLAEFMRHSVVWAVAFSPDGDRLASGGLDTVRLWNAHTGDPLGEPLKHSNVLASVAFSPDGDRLATFCRDNTLRVWKVPPITLPSDISSWLTLWTGYGYSEEKGLTAISNAEWLALPR